MPTTTIVYHEAGRRRGLREQRCSRCDTRVLWIPKPFAPVVSPQGRLPGYAEGTTIAEVLVDGARSDPPAFFEPGPTWARASSDANCAPAG